VSPPNKTPGRVIERPIEVDPENGYASLSGISVPESKRSLWLRLLWEERRFLRKFTSWGLLAALLLAFLIPHRYESRTRLMPPDQQSGSGLAILAALAGGRGASSSGSGGSGGALGGALGNVAGDLLGIKSSGALFVDMLDGPMIQDNLIQKFDLLKVYGDRYWEDGRRDLAKHTDVKEDRKSGVITIAVTDRDPHRAQQMAQAYVDALNGLVARVSTSSARRERIFLEDRLKTVKQSLDNASQEFSEFASKNGTFDVPSQTKAMVENEASLEGQLVAAQSELEGLRQVYTDNNVRVRSLQARVATLQHQVENMSGNKADLSSDQSQIPGNFPSIRKLPLVGVRWANLYRETKVQETVYELLVQEYEVAKIQEAKEIPTVNVLDPAMLPERKSFPPRILITILGTLFAFFLASTLIIGSYAWKQNQSPEKQLATEIWAQIIARDSRTRHIAHQVWSKLSGRNGSSGSKAA
jgi:capsule polysaccharide export protein KpsE/RkpR